ncbi:MULTISPECIES: LacI family DNA-binding transcriptional regulator [Streptomyces]|uniref:LacI family transcriptional regulator n=1 Tax=Streptomyces cadmiisoli TaxID=2184053 RepID=A0A2Z4IS74_9ACTN|nr:MULTISPECIES: LacI family DNA-binding transcriptional regulator [Streptomyces]AWW35478.1 LacI family transcriptional regulator [Streptomyces cadmiisoli]KOV54482.1 LacI family transcriptional regulator [Streptomyces sp. AS58]
MGDPTVYDVAERAGVSIATVSRVYRMPDSVRVATRERVLSAAYDLGYLPSASARGLASRATGVLGLCFPDFADPEAEGTAPDADEAELSFYGDEVIRGMERAARRHGYALLISAAHADRAGEVLSDVAGRVDGLAILAQHVPPAVLDVVSRRLPLVVLAGPLSSGLDAVEVANFDGLLELTRHLIDGHRLKNLAFVGGAEDSPDAEARFRGFQAAHLAAGLPLPERPSVRGDLTLLSGRKAAMELLDGEGPRPQGMVFANDQMAVGALQVLAERGIRVPTDLAVTGFDGIPLGRLVTPALTTVRQPMSRLGEEAVELLVARIADRGRPALSRTLPTTLALRASCGCGV